MEAESAVPDAIDAARRILRRGYAGPCARRTLKPVRLDQRPQLWANVDR
jgi:hypothetical protein